MGIAPLWISDIEVYRYRIVEAACDGVLLRNQMRVIKSIYDTLTNKQKKEADDELERLDRALRKCDTFLYNIVVDKRMSSLVGSG